MICEYLEKSSVHGLKYIGEKRSHWSESIVSRLFWFLACVASGCISIRFMLASWDDFNNEAVSFVPDTSYLDWNTSFPAITICESGSFERMFEYCRSIYSTDDLLYDCTAMMMEIAFFAGTCSDCKSGSGSIVKWPQADYYTLTKQLRMSCGTAFLECKWKGTVYNCCQIFSILRSEVGPCFSLNSLQTKSAVVLDYTSNKEKGLADLEVKVAVDFKLYIHAPDDVPFWSMSDGEVSEGHKGEVLERSIKVTDIENDVEIHELSVEQRQCKLNSEIPPDFLYSVYSHSACVVQCHSKRMMALCNCSVHFLPQSADTKPCGKEGLGCISDHFAEIKGVAVSTTKDSEESECYCPPSCSEPDYQLIWNPVINGMGSSKEYAVIRIKLAYLPSERFKRTVICGMLDLVVSIGSLAGLFLGASLLSVLELLYFICIRPIGNMLKP